jgi:hypothetical protein
MDRLKEKKRLFFDHLNLRRKKQRRNKGFLTCIKSCLRRWEWSAYSCSNVSVSAEIVCSVCMRKTQGRVSLFCGLCFALSLQGFFGQTSNIPSKYIRNLSFTIEQLLYQFYPQIFRDSRLKFLSFNCVPSIFPSKLYFNFQERIEFNGFIE